VSISESVSSVTVRTCHSRQISVNIGRDLLKRVADLLYCTFHFLLVANGDIKLESRISCCVLLVQGVCPPNVRFRAPLNEIQPNDSPTVVSN
jgi:hypothetical protein